MHIPSRASNKDSGLTDFPGPSTYSQNHESVKSPHAKRKVNADLLGAMPHLAIQSADMCEIFFKDLRLS